MELQKAIKKRKSVRKFKTKKPDWRDIIECIDSARYAPMAGNLFTPRFILIDDKSTIQKLAEAAQQDFIAEAKYVVIVCSSKEKTINSFGERAEIYVRQQTGAAIQNFLLSLEEKGLATCWIGHFVEEQVKRVAKIPDNVQVEAFFPIGYAYSDAKGRKKVMIDDVLYFHNYKNKRMKIPRMPYA